jgi:hypothetical protein
MQSLAFQYFKPFYFKATNNKNQNKAQKPKTTVFSQLPLKSYQI